MSLDKISLNRLCRILLGNDKFTEREKTPGSEFALSLNIRPEPIHTLNSPIKQSQVSYSLFIRRLTNIHANIAYL